MSGRRASPSREVFTDRVHELSIRVQAAADLDQLLTAAAGLRARAWCVSQAGFTPAALTFTAENDILICWTTMRGMDGALAGGPGRQAGIGGRPAGGWGYTSWRTGQGGTSGTQAQVSSGMFDSFILHSIRALAAAQMRWTLGKAWSSRCRAYGMAVCVQTRA